MIDDIIDLLDDDDGDDQCRLLRRSIDRSLLVTATMSRAALLCCLTSLVVTRRL